MAEGLNNSLPTRKLDISVSVSAVYRFCSLVEHDWLKTSASVHLSTNPYIQEASLD